jgi:hypothetical protein
MMAYGRGRPILRASWLRDWIGDNKIPAGSLLIDEQRRLFKGIEPGEHFSEQLGIRRSVVLTRGPDAGLTAGEFTGWLEANPTYAEDWLSIDMFDGTRKAVKDLNMTETLDGQPAVIIQLRWG